MPHRAAQIIRDEHAALSAMLRSLSMMIGQGPGEQPERFFDVDDEHVLVLVHVSVVGTESGIPVEMEVAHEFTIRDGLVVYFKVYVDRDEALAASGISQ